MDTLRQYIRDLLVEKELRKDKDKRTLYHINVRPARPQPKMKYLEDWNPDVMGTDGERGDLEIIPDTDNWQRHWLDQPVKSGVFLTPNPKDIAEYHGRSGNVYAYEVPEWVIAKAGGLHRYDHGSEVLISEEIWEEAGNEIEFLGKSMTQDQLWDSINQVAGVGRGMDRQPSQPSWLSAEELAAWKASKEKFNLRGLRNTNHPEDVIKMLKPEEIKAALVAFESESPEAASEHLIKDEQLIDLLKKQLDESKIRNYIRKILT